MPATVHVEDEGINGEFVDAHHDFFFARLGGVEFAGFDFVGAGGGGNAEGGVVGVVIHKIEMNACRIVGGGLVVDEPGGAVPVADEHLFLFVIAFAGK